MSTASTQKHVIFGAGPLGLAVMDALVERGATDVTVVNRSGQIKQALPAGVRVTTGDVTQPDEVARLASDAGIVFQCAQPAYSEWPEKFPPIIRSIINGVSRTQAKLVVGDNLYMYGPTGGKPVREDLPYAAIGPKGKTRAEMAQALLDAHRAGKVRVTIGRTSDFYGPRVLGSAAGEIVFGAAVAGKAINLMGNIDLPHTFAYIKDFGRGLVTLSEHDAALGQAWHVPTAPTITTRQFVRLIEKELGRPVKMRVAGRTMVSLLGLFVPEIREMKEMAYEFTEPYVVDDSRFVQAFGAQTTSHEAAIRETIAWFPQHLHA